MHKQKNHPHFQNKDPLEHIIDARKKGKKASEDIHGVEPRGSFHAASDAVKETAFALSVLTLLFSTFDLPNFLLFNTFFLIGFALWKGGRSALIGWSALEKLHRTIQEERWEIEHHREQEKEELTALYAAKGFSEPLLSEVISVLMADDDRLLQVMLQEELGLDLETHEHPLQQALGAFLGTSLSGALLLILSLISPLALYSGAIVLLSLSAGIAGKRNHNAWTLALFWNLGVAVVSLFAIHAALQLVISQ